MALAHEAAINGAAGLCVGRNVFQRERPDDLIEQVRRIFEDIEVSGFERVPPARPMLASPS